MIVNTKLRIPISNASITELERRYVDDCMATGMISGTGSYVRRFEQALATWVDRKHACAVMNGTAALEIALTALGVGAGDEVLVPAMTFVAPAAAIRRMGATVRLVDVGEDDWCIDPKRVADHITPRTKAIIAVDIFGHPANFYLLRQFGLPIIEDAAQAHGAQYDGQMCGSLGDISTFSFFANKALTTGEGGAVLTDDDELAERIRLLVNHGMTPQRRYWHEVVGTNARLSNLQAAIGLAQVERSEALTGRRRQVAARYRANIPPQWGFEGRPVASERARESCYLFTLLHPDRDRIIRNLNDMGIDARRVWYSISEMPLYMDSAFGEYPVSERICQQGLSLPTSALMTDAEVDDVIECLGRAVYAY